MRIRAGHPGFHRRLQRWYAANGRKDLPWRNTADPYAIYVSEVMLQQTQVATVLDRYYSPFLKRFPTVASLAKAGREDVLRVWQGLGYYNRAIHLHEAVKQCGKRLPDSVEALMALPGVGRNTAHAVAAFAYHQAVAVMEANVRRVLSRMFALSQPSENILWEKAAELLDRKNPFDHNQAMMDLGALVCTRRAPKCGECPAEKLCLGKASPESYPAAKKKKPTPMRRKNIVVLRNGSGEYFASPRQSRFLKGLYHFVESDDSRPPPRARKLGAIRQQYSHFTLEADIYMATARRHGKDWHTLAQLKKLPVSMAEKKIIGLLDATPKKKSRAHPW